MVDIKKLLGDEFKSGCKLFGRWSYAMTAHNYREHKFKRWKDAEKKQSEMLKKYGYKPTIMKISKGPEKFFAVVEPKNLKVI